MGTEAVTSGETRDFQAMAGDLGLLVPLEATWRLLDLSGHQGIRGSRIAPWVGETVIALDADASVASSEEESSVYRVRCGRRLPFRPGSFDLVLLEQGGLWGLDRARPLLRAGGFLVWIQEAPPLPPFPGKDLERLLRFPPEAMKWLGERLSIETTWRKTLSSHDLEYVRAWVHVREYTWGYLPFDAPEVHRYYLEAVQEEGVGRARGKAQLARMLCRLGLYRYLVSAWLVVARAPDTRPRRKGP